MTFRLWMRSVGLVIATGWAALGCAPAFQDARLVGPGRMEVTPSFSPTGISADGESEHVANNFGAHVIAGVHDRLDLGAGFMRTQIVDEDDGANLIGFGPKVGIVRDRVAFALPMGFAAGEDVDVSETFTLQPMGLFTLPVSGTVDLNPSARLVIPTCDGCEVLVGVNFGVGIRMPNPVVILRPEIGFLWNPGEEGTVWSFGIGVSFRTR